MDIGSRISELRKKKNWSQSDLAKAINVSRIIVGRYERNEAAPSIDIAKKMAEAFEVSLDYLVGEGQNATFDKKTVQRLQEIESMKPDFKEKIFFFIDTMIRDYKAGQAYSQ